MAGQVTATLITVILRSRAKRGVSKDAPPAAILRGSPLRGEHLRMTDWKF